MAFELSRNDTYPSLFSTAGLAMASGDGNGTSGTASRRPPTPFAGWNRPKWGLFLLLVLAGNVLMATLAWLIVGWIRWIIG